MLLAAPGTAVAQQTTAICHATGDPNSPYVLVELAPEATVEHLQHGGDLVPAPAGGCPARLVGDPAYPLPAPTAAPRPDVIPPRARPRPPRGRRQREARAQVAPAAASGNLGATATVESDTLPLTGGEVPAMALMGLGFLLAGAGLRLRYDGW